MMIKFRAWDKVQKVMMVPRDMQTDSDGNIFYVEARSLDGEYDEGDLDVFELEQFTGLKDVNGNEIYAGDIIQYFGANRRVKVKKEFGVVVFKADRYGSEFTSVIQNAEHGFGGISPLNDLVVGNVHVNPELLEVKNETDI